MRTETIEIFTFDELSDEAKEKARNWWRDCEEQNGINTEFLYEDFEYIGKILGIEFDQRDVSLMNGSSHPKIWWSGFSSQGDGACFEGYYSYAKNASKLIRKYAPNDKKLHYIADMLQAIQRPAFYRLSARINYSGRYYHAYCMTVHIEYDGERWPTDDEENGIQEAMRDFADWMYDRIEAEYNWIMSADHVDEAIRCNEYEFTADGSRYI